MITREIDDIADEAESWTRRLKEAGIPSQIIDGRSRIGGGSLPGSSLPTKLVAIEAVDAEQFAARLRQADCPVIGRIQDNRLLIDPRTVFPHQGQILIQALLKEHSQNE